MALLEKERYYSTLLFLSDLDVSGADQDQKWER